MVFLCTVKAVADEVTGLAPEVGIVVRDIVAAIVFV